MKKSTRKIGGLEVVADAQPSAELMEFLTTPQPEYLEPSKTAEAATFDDLRQRLTEAMLEQKVGRLLAEARQLRQVSTRELAKVLGWNQSRVVQVEHSSNPEVGTLAMVAAALRCRVEIRLIPEEGGEPLVASVPSLG